MVASKTDPDPRPTRRCGVDAAVLLCADPTVGDATLGEVLEPALREGVPGVPVLVVPDVCSGSRRSKDLLRELCPERVVVACRHGRTQRDEIVAHLRRAGVHYAGIGVVDLAMSEGYDVRRAAAECAVRVEAALALVSAGDLSVVGKEKIAFDAVRMSRRGLFRFATLASRPVVSWVESRCDYPSTCRSCVTACPQGALSLAGSRLLVDAERCVGCGACLAACRAGALELSGTSVEALEHAANVLASGARVLSPPGGIAITCARAPAVPLGEGWLPFEAPSLEMVTAGWVLQLLAAGAPVRLVACEGVACSTRARAIVTLCRELLTKVAQQGERPSVATDDIVVSPTRGPDHLASVKLREPDATIRALSAMQVTANSSSTSKSRSSATAADGSWRIESWVSPLGDLSVDPESCSGCGLCALSCRSGALTDERGDHDFVLSFDAALCSACSACALSCPEEALSLVRAVDSCALAPHRRSLVVSSGPRRCRSCGHPVGAGLSVGRIAASLVGSHTELAGRLARSDRCADCMLQRRDGVAEASPPDPTTPPEICSATRRTAW